jgi:3-hydroxyisobutyrate dehydrogenase-like beta-hydroxyacid dehydrogenase
MAITPHAKLGFVGHGHMGGNMAARFLDAGYEVYGEERSREHPHLSRGRHAPSRSAAGTSRKLTLSALST